MERKIQVFVGLTVTERDALRKLAGEQHRSLSSTIRQIVVKAISDAQTIQPAQPD